LALKRLMLLAVFSLSCFYLLSSPLPVVAAESPAVVNWLDEHLGDFIPLDTRFTDSTGKSLRLGDFVDRPTLIVPVYYRCRNVCNLTLGGLAEALPDIRLEAGTDFRVLAYSIDPSETPALAAHTKKTFMTAMNNALPADSWVFLTGDEHNIRLLSDAAGWHFKKQGEDFLHPVATFVVSSEGKIVRYLNGYRFSSINLTMALIEAAENRIGRPMRAVMQFCFSYDPQGREYTFNLLRISATVILLTLGSFLLFLIFGGRKKTS